MGGRGGRVVLGKHTPTRLMKWDSSYRGCTANDLKFVKLLPVTVEFKHSSHLPPPSCIENMTNTCQDVI